MRREALLTSSRGFAQAITFLTAVIMARLFRVEDYGRYVFAQALAAILIVVVDHGGQFHLVQRYARHPEAAASGLGRSWAIRVLLAALIFPTVLVVWWLDPADTARTLAVAVVLMGAWCDAALLLAFAAFRVEERFSRESFWTVTGAIVRLLVTLGGSAARLAFLPLLAGLTLGKAVVGLASNAEARRRIAYPWRGVWRGLGGEWRASMPFQVFAFTGIVYFQVGTLMVSHSKGPEAAALYQAAYMLFLGAMLIPDAVSSVAYPGLSRDFAEGGTRFGEHARRLLARLGTVGLISAAGLTWLGPAVVRLLFPPQFGAAVTLLPWLGIAIALRSLSYGLGTLLHACDGQNARARNNAMVLLVLLAGASIRVPRAGATGMVQVFVLAEAVLVGLEAWGLHAALARRARSRVAA